MNQSNPQVTNFVITPSSAESVVPAVFRPGIMKGRYLLQVILITALGCLLLPMAVQAELTATVDATEITTEQSLRLVVTSTSSGSDEQPDLSELAKDFEILGRSEQTNLQTIGNKMSQSRSWHIELAPKRKGVAVIPGFTVSSETTEPITINVAAPRIRKPGESKGDYYLEASVDKNSAYVQSQIIYTLRIYSIQNFLEGSLSEVQPEGMQVQELGDTRSYREVINGKSYQVLEKKYALAAQRSGEITIPPVSLNASVAKPGAHNRGIFTPSEAVRRKSEPVDITVLPRPESSGNDWWLPAADVQLASQWEGEIGELRVGDSVTRNVALLADGVSSTQLPELPLPSHPAFKIYASEPQLDEQVTKQGLAAVRQEKWAVVVLQPGTLTLPEMTVPWFNTNTGQTENAVLPAETLTVLAVEPADRGVVSPNPPAVQPGSGNNNQGSDLGDAAELEAAAATLASTIASLTTRVTRWKWVAVALVVAWLLTTAILLSLLAGRFRAKPLSAERRGRVEPPSLAAVQNACESGNPHASSEALLDWAKEFWPDSPPRTLVALATRFDSIELRDELATLDSLLYASPARGGQPDNAAGTSVKKTLLTLARSLAQAVAQQPAKKGLKTSSALPGL